MKYYLVHAVVDPTPAKIMKILLDGFLYSNIVTKQYGIYADEPLQYIYFSLFHKIITFHGGVTFILDDKILYKRSFRYALNWVGSHIEKTIKVTPKDNVLSILNKIDRHIQQISNKESKTKIVNIMTSHEILIKKKVNLHRYLVAICEHDVLTDDIREYIHNYYPNVKILDTFPNSSEELTEIIKYSNKN